jgi:hypothetical protein
LGSVSKITEVAKYLGRFFHGASYFFVLTKNGLGFILGDFFSQIRLGSML